jgi:NitT/TauT family transport system permease protein
VAAVVIGVPLGLIMGRSRTVDGSAGALVDVMMVTPMVVVMPIVLMALGLTRQSQAVVVLLFALPYVAVPCRTGVRGIDRGLIEMSHSFGAREWQLWRDILLPGATPAVVTGLRLGFGQAITGMVVVELTLLSIGIGNVLLSYQHSFQAAKMFALIGLVVVESVIVLGALRLLESRVATASPSVSARLEAEAEAAPA